MRAGEQPAERRLDVLGADARLLDRAQVVAGLVHRRLAPVDEQRRGSDELGVQLPRRRDGRADRVDVRPGRDRFDGNDRFVRRRAEADDIGSLRRFLVGRHRLRPRVQHC